MKDHLHLHFIVLLFGFTAILGKFISLDAASLTAYRMALATVGIGLFAVFGKRSLRMHIRGILRLFVVGGLVALHWITFFAAVKVSNVSVTLGCLASATLFTAFLEPLIERRRIFWVEIVLGLLIIAGLYLITRFAFHYLLGIAYALLSAFLAALFGVLNKQLVKYYSPIAVSFYEMLAGSIIITFFLLLGGGIPAPSGLDWVWLLLLAWICTSYAFVALVYLFKRLSAFVVSLAINMEPVYGILLALLIFGESEYMNGGFYFGALLVIAAIAVYPMLKKRFEP